MKKQLIIISLLSLFSIDTSYSSLEQSISDERQEMLEHLNSFKLQLKEIEKSLDIEKFTNLLETINAYLLECARLGFDSKYEDDYKSISIFSYKLLACEFQLIYETINDIDNYEKFKNFRAKAILIHDFLDPSMLARLIIDFNNVLYIWQNPFVGIYYTLQNFIKESCASGEYLYPLFYLKKFNILFISLPSLQAYKDAFLAKYNNITDIKNFEEFKDIALSLDEFCNLHSIHRDILPLTETDNLEIIQRIEKLAAEYNTVNPGYFQGSFRFKHMCQKYFSFDLLI